MKWHPMSERPQDESAVYIIQTSDQGYQAAELHDGCFESYPAGEMTSYLHLPETVVRWAVAETGVVEPVAESRRKDVHPAELTANEMIDNVTRVTQEDIDFQESVYEQAKLILTYGHRAESDGGEKGVNMIPTSYEEELMLYTLVEKKDKRTEYCHWCKEPTSYRIKERECVLTRDRLTFGCYCLKAFCEKCEGRMIVPWIVHENMMRIRDAYENARAKATESDGGER